MRAALCLAIVATLAACGAARAPYPAPTLPITATPALPSPPAPADDATPALRRPEVRTFVVASGITVQIVERHDAPAVFVGLAGRGARSLADGTPAALDALVQRALGAGLPRELGATAREDDLVRGYVSGRGLVTVSRVVPASIDRVLERYAQLVGGEGIADDEIERARVALTEHARFASEQRARRTYPPAGEELYTRLYGADDPRVGASRILAANLDRLGPRDVRRRIAQFLRPAETSLVIVGDVSAAELEPRIRARWDRVVAPDAPATRQAAAPPTFPVPGQRLRIHGSGDEDLAVVRLVERGPPREHADYAAFRVLSRLAGGMFSARLNLRFREQRGDTYGVATSVIDAVDHSLLEIEMIVPVSHVGDAATAIVEELARLGDASRIEDEELRLARIVEAAGLAERLDSAWGVGWALSRAWLAREPADSLITPTIACARSPPPTSPAPRSDGCVRSTRR